MGSAQSQQASGELSGSERNDDGSVAAIVNGGSALKPSAALGRGSSTYRRRTLEPSISSR